MALIVPVIAALVAGLRGLAAAGSSDPVRAVRGRLWLALGTFGLVLIAALLWTTSEPSLLGLPIVVGPGAAAIAGLLAFTLPPSRSRTSGGVRVATLRARSAGQVMGGRVLLLPVVLLVVLVGVLVTTGLTADGSGDAAGRRFSATGAGVGAGAGPFPGWFYGVPILMTAAVLVLAVAVAVRRTVLLPAVTADAAADAAWRSAVGRTFGSIAAAGLLLYLAGVLWAAGAAWQVLEQIGTDGLGPIRIAQGTAVAVAAIAAVVLLVVATARVATVGRTLTGRPVPA